MNIDRISFFDNYTLTYTLSPKTAVYIEGQYDAIDYDQGVPLYDYHTIMGTGGFGYQWSPKLNFFGEVYYGQSATEPNFAAPKPPHSEFIGGFIGTRMNFAERLTGMIKAGYEQRQFSDNTPTQSAPVVETALTYRYSPLGAATFSYSRRTRVSVQFARESYTSDSISLQLNQSIGPSGQLVGTLGGSYSLYDYERVGLGGTRSDSWYRANVGLTYRFRLWLAGMLAYEYESFSSDLQGIIDYGVNRITLRLAVGY